MQVGLETAHEPRNKTQKAGGGAGRGPRVAELGLGVGGKVVPRPPAVHERLLPPP